MFFKELFEVNLDVIKFDINCLYYSVYFSYVIFGVY